MKKLFFSIIIAFLAFFTAMASETSVKVTQSDETGTTLVFNIGTHQLNKVETPRGTAFIPSIDEAVSILNAGYPAMLRISESIVIPDKGNTEISVVDAKFDVYSNIEIAPSKGNLYRNVLPKDVPYTYGEVYSQNSFYPTTIAELTTPYIARDFRGQAVWVNPTQYNAVTKELRVYTQITVKVTPTNKKGENELNRTRAFTKVSAPYNHIYKNRFANYTQAMAKYTPLSEEGNMLVIAPDEYMETMIPFVEWKNQSGIPTEIVSLSDVGSTASQIETYIADYYTNNQVTFVLLVGDDENLPATSTSSGDSDMAYGYMEGNDTYPEIIIGRFSGTVADVENMVEKNQIYEQTPTTTDAMYDRFMLIASSEGGGGQGDDGESDVDHMRNIKPDLTGFTYTETDSYELFDGSHGEMDASGNPSATDVVDAINNGVGVMGYVGHGSDYILVTTGFGTSNMNSLTNTEFFPFMFDVACINGNFAGNTCFAEGFVRATHNDQPTGALAICASTINQSWAPPMSGQDEMFDLVVNSYEENIKHTFGGIHVNGCMQMNDDYGSEGDKMTDTWTIFGDPSVMVRTATPQEITYEADPIIFLGSTEYSVTADAVDGRATLSIGGEIVATANVLDGAALLEFDAITEPLVGTLTITGFNNVPVITEVEFIPADGPYVKVDGYSINDEQFNNNQLADYGETISLSLDFGNVGTETAYDVTVAAATTSEYITLSGDNYLIGDINADGTASANDIFEVIVAENAPDQHKAEIIFTIQDGSEKVWESTIDLTLNAPVIEMASATMIETIGNENGHPDAGELMEIAIEKFNSGHAASLPFTTTLNALTNNIEVVDAEITDNGIEPQTTHTASHKFNVSSEAVTGDVISVEVVLTYQEIEIKDTITASVGLVIEDFESGDYTTYEWINDETYPWEIVESPVYEGVYAAKSGTITDNQTSELSITVEVGSDDQISFMQKASSESGYDFLRFYIDGVEQDEWSGAGEWTEQTYDVTAGERTFTWKYEKDGSVSSNDDCGYIDYIIFPSFDDGSANENTLPEMSFEGDTTAYSDREFAINFTGTDADEDELTFSAAGTPEWMTFVDNGDGTAALTATNAPYETIGDSYAVVVGVNDGKSVVTETINIDVLRYPVGINGINNGGLTIYPNPANDVLNINYSLNASEKVNATIYNMNGQVVQQITSGAKATGNHTEQVNIGQLPAGIYYVQVNLNNNISTQKFIVTD
ncbi:MAG: C25 family cysteine peptidase [Salinivirgaceae bacterium]